MDHVPRERQDLDPKATVVYLVANKKRRYINVDGFDKSNVEMILFDVAKSLMTNRALIADYGQLFAYP